jgi:hypothetical protein
MANDASGVEGINIDWTVEPAEPGLTTGVHRRHLGQPDNKVGTTVANQGEGTVAIGIVPASGVLAFNLSDTKLTASSRVYAQVQARDTASDGGTIGNAANQGALVVLIGKPTGPGAGLATVLVRNLSAQATLATDYVLQYWITN